MKITRLKVTSKFRSLPKGFEITFDENEPSEKAINPICFVGKNGTGKSNVIEFLCEIFYYLETLHLPFYESGKQFKLGFELDYFKYGFDRQKTKVTIKKQSNHKYPTLTVDEYETTRTIERKDITGKEEKDTLKRLLPHQVIGYSSGLNELVSNPFIRMQFNYFYDYRKGLEDGLPEIGGSSRLSFMDYDSNALVLLANYLIQDEVTERKLETVNEKIEVEDIDSFRLVICGDLKDKNAENLTEFSFIENSIMQPFTDEINSLKKCATAIYLNSFRGFNAMDFIEKTDDELFQQDRLTTHQIIFDFKVTEATKQAFTHYFGTAQKLYQFLQRLNTLNINTFTEEQIETVRKADKDFNISSYLPKKSNDELLFYVDKLQLKKTGSNEPIAYNGLSDGEHQFLHIIGTALLMDEPDTIFFLDEPETHYNPMWRSKLVSTLNEVADNTENKSRQQMFVITTHSPFILSDCYQQHVFKFRRDDGVPKAEMIDIRTFGTSFNRLLKKAFDKKATISELSDEKIKEQMEIAKNTNNENKLFDIKEEVSEMGESIEKVLLLEFVNRKLLNLQVE